MANTRTKRSSKRRTRKNGGSPLKVSIALRSKRRQTNHRRRRAQLGGISEVTKVIKIMDALDTIEDKILINFFKKKYYDNKKTVSTDLRKTSSLITSTISKGSDEQIFKNAFTKSKNFILNNAAEIIKYLEKNYSNVVYIITKTSKEELIAYVKELLEEHVAKQKLEDVANQQSIQEPESTPSVTDTKTSRFDRFKSFFK